MQTRHTRLICGRSTERLFGGAMPLKKVIYRGSNPKKAESGIVATTSLLGAFFALAVCATARSSEGSFTLWPLELLLRF
jgi:hypothetical protein